MKNFQDYMVMEWSNSQKCFHVFTVKDMLKSNASTVLIGSKTDYIPIAIAATYDELKKIQARNFLHLMEEHAVAHKDFPI